MREKHKKGKKVLDFPISFIFSRHITKMIEKMEQVSNDIRWFCNQLRLAEEILANALEKTEDFSEYDKQIVDKIKHEVQMTDLTLLQLLSPKGQQIPMI